MSIDPSSLKSCMLVRVQFQRCILDKLILIGRGTKALETLVTFLYILYESLNVFWRTSFTKKTFSLEPYRVQCFPASSALLSPYDLHIDPFSIQAYIHMDILKGGCMQWTSAATSQKTVLRSV